MNTTLRNIIWASYVVFCFLCWFNVVSTITSLLIGFVIYQEAFCSDIKYQFGQMNRLSERKISTSPKLKDSCSSERENFDLLMLERFRDAVDLHQKTNRYRLHPCISSKRWHLLRNSVFSD